MKISNIKVTSFIIPESFTLHRENGPAYITLDGYIAHYEHGECKNWWVKIEDKILTWSYG